LLKFIAIEPGLLELLQKVAGVRFFFWDTVYMQHQLPYGITQCYRPPVTGERASP